VNELSHNQPRPRRGSSILKYISNFSATEKAIFGIFTIAALISALVMAKMVNDYFSIEVPAHGGTLNEGIVGLPRTINPILAITDADRDISALVYSGLAKYVDGKLVTDLAQTYKISEDGYTYSFTLKPKLRFHDGTALTTEDIAFTIQKIQDPALKSPRRADWADVVVKVISPTEIEFTLKQPYSPFLSNTTIGIIPKHIWGSVSDDQFIFSQYNMEPIGSGPYEYDSVSRNSGGIPTTYTLSASSGYYGRKPYISTIIFNFFEDEATALIALDQGVIDSLSAISPYAAAKLAADSAQPYTIVSSPLPRVFGIFFNQNESTVLADKIVRQALDMSIDRTDLIDRVLSGYGVPITGAVPSIEVKKHSTAPVASSTPLSLSTTTDTIRPEIRAAAQLLEKNGWKKNTDGIYTKKPAKTAAITLAFDIYTADSVDLKKAAEIVRDTWNELGAQVTVKVYETTDLYQNVIRTRKYDALLFGEAIGKDRDMYAFWHSSQRNAPGLNIAMYTNSKADKLLEEIRASNDEAIRANKYRAFDELIRADIPALFLYMPEFIYAIPRTLHDVDLNSTTIPSDRWNGIREWYLETEHVWNIFNRYYNE